MVYNLDPCSKSAGPVFYQELPDRIHGISGVWLAFDKQVNFSSNSLNNRNYANTKNITNTNSINKTNAKLWKDTAFPGALLRRVNSRKRGLWIFSPCEDRKVGSRTVKRATRDVFKLWFRVGKIDIPINVVINRR